MNLSAVAVGLAAAFALAGTVKTETINGYAEFKRGDTLIVEGQRVVATQRTRLKGAKRIAEHSPRVRMDRLRPSYVPASALRVRVVKTDQWNASAMANGAIWVYTGLMDALTDDELAIVLGHELTHYTHEHIRRQMSKGTVAQILGTGAAIAVSQIKNSTAQQVAAFGGQLGLSALMTGYSRDHEDQADRVGLRYVYEAGFDPTKGPGLWQRFKDKYGETDKITNFFTGDHSRPTERIRNIQRQIQLNYATPPKKP